MTIDLDEIIDAIQGSTYDIVYYLNVKTGEIIMRDEHLPIRELNDIDDELDKNWENILEIPTQRDAKEFRMMKDFVWQLPEGQAKDALNTALQGQGAFRRFKDAAKNYNLLNDWYEFEDNKYVEFARNWCEENEVAFAEVPKIVYRHATRRDMETLIQLKKKELGVEDDSLDFELERYFTAQLRNNNLYQIFAWWKNRIVTTGAIAWTFLPPTVEQPNGRVGRLVNFWCDEDVKNNGYEKEIIKRLLEESKRRKIKDVLAFEGDAKMLEECGFTKDEHVFAKSIRLDK